jgi:hypothetical protein
MNQTQLENMIDEAYKLHADHKEDEILRDNFNGLQMMYHEMYEMWYIPARKVELDLWANSRDLTTGYQEDAYSHE